MDLCRSTAAAMSMIDSGAPAAAKCSRIRIPRSSVCDGGAPAPSSAFIAVLPWREPRSSLRMAAARAGGTSVSPCGPDRAGHLAERDSPTGGPGCGCGDDDDVAVLEERAGGAVGQGERFLAAPRQLDEGAALVLGRAGDGAGGEQV